jgi:diguanylate cyclase (GGDEF)-like protein/PAS domain S-box-containing protein
MSEMLDISLEMQALEALHASEQLLRRLAGALPVGVLQLDQAGTPVYVNERFRQLLGSQSDDDCSLEGRVVESDALAAATAEALAGHDIDMELHIDPVDGSCLRRCTLAFRALTTPDGHVTGAVGCLTDITDERRMRAELEWRATVDAMTGCANRSSTMLLLEEVLTASSKPAAVVFVDLDRFKAVNDLHGHGTGDDLLVAVAARLRSAVRDVDLVGRIGGDEFLIVCPDVREVDSVAIGDRVLAALDAPFLVGDQTLHASASIGIARSVAGEAPDALIARADAAMYESKRQGGHLAVVAE